MDEKQPFCPACGHPESEHVRMVAVDNKVHCLHNSTFLVSTTDSHPEGCRCIDHRMPKRLIERDLTGD